MTRKPSVIEQGNWILEWRVRRSQLEVDVFEKNKNGTKGKLWAELGYPKIAGIGFSDFTREVIAIAEEHKNWGKYP